MAISFLYPVWLWLLLLGLLFVGLGWPARHSPNRRRQWLSLTVRLVILVALVLGLAGAQLEWPLDTITTVFVLDASDSIAATDRLRAETFVSEAIAHKPSGDQAAIILFGGDALVERLPSEESTLSPLASVPLKNATNIEQALRLALALLPGEGGGRIVLLSDGRQTTGEARRLADLAAARHIEISVYPLGDETAGPAEVLVEEVSAPGQARQGQSIPLKVVVVATQSSDAMLRLLADGVLVESKPVRLSPGRNQFEFSVLADEAGFRRFQVQVEAEQDGYHQNNRGAAFTTVHGPPKLLLVEGEAGEGAALAAALEAGGLHTTVIPPAMVPANLLELAAYEAVILANVPAEALPEAQQETLVSFVRDLGRGLVMVGGPESYGAGGYLRSPLETALPVEMEVRSRSREPNIALVLAVDKSGSMGACHCDNPNLNQPTNRVPSGIPKVDIAKEAIFQAALVLGDLDYMGVVSFDSEAHWELQTGPRVGGAELEQAIGGIIADGQTNIFAGLSAAEESLTTTPARIKHIILLTDGWSHAGAYDDLTARLAEEGITLSVVAAGGGSAEYLAELAEKGGGHYYPAANMDEVPQVFLKETIRAIGHYIIEEPFLPAPVGLSTILHGIDVPAAPPLLGYNGATPKAAAQVLLLTPRGDPLLTTWQYGLGRSVAWTSDLSGRWAKNWLTWSDFTRFTGQLVGWSLPPPGDERLDLAVTVNGGQATLTADVRDEAGRPRSFLSTTARLIAADGETIAVELRPVGPGRYQADASLPEEGVYLAQVTAEDEAGLPAAGQTIGLVMPYSPEYAAPGVDPYLLADLGRATAGHLLTEPAQAFAHTLPAGHQSRPIWPTLLLAAALLFPVDVAVRRLQIGRREWAELRGRLARRSATSAKLPLSPTPSLQAFQRVRERRPPAASSSPPAEALPAPPEQPPASPPPEPDDGQPSDTLARLRAAKKRAKR